MDDRDFLSPDEHAQALDPSVGAGSPDTAPWEDPTVSLLRRYPVALFGLVLFLPALTAALVAWAQGETTVAIITSAVSAVVAVLTPLVHQAVTPVAKPRLDSDTPLVPAFSDEFVRTLDAIAGDSDGEAGYTLVEVGLFLVLLAVAAAVVVAFVT